MNIYSKIIQQGVQKVWQRLNGQRLNCRKQRKTSNRRPLRLLMSFTPMFPIYVNFTVNINLYPLYLLGYLKKKQENSSVSSALMQL